MLLASGGRGDAGLRIGRARSGPNPTKPLLDMKFTRMRYPPSGRVMRSSLARGRHLTHRRAREHGLVTAIHPTRTLTSNYLDEQQHLEATGRSLAVVYGKHIKEQATPFSMALLLSVSTGELRDRECEGATIEEYVSKEWLSLSAVDRRDGVPRVVQTVPGHAKRPVSAQSVLDPVRLG